MTRPVESKKEALGRLRAAGAKLTGFGVIRIGLFGSFITNRQTQTSDINILVEFTPDRHSFDNFMDLSFFLEDLLGREVDLVTVDALSPHIGPHILKEVERVAFTA